MTDLDLLCYFLDIEITSHPPDDYCLFKQHYTQDLFAHFNLTNTRTTVTPIELHLQFHASNGIPLSDSSLAIDIWLAAWST